MTECGELPFLDGMGDVMMMNNDAFSSSVLYGGDIKDDESDGLSYSTNVQDNPSPVDWNVDNMAGYDNDNLSDLFGTELFDGAFDDDTPNLESLLGESFSKLEEDSTAVNSPASFNFPSPDGTEFESPSRGTKRQIDGEGVDVSDAAIFNEFISEKNTFKQCRTNGISNVNGAASSGQDCSTSPSTSTYFDTFIPTISLPDLMSPKQEVETRLPTSSLTTTVGHTVVGGIAGVSTFGGLVECKPETSTSPPYSNSSEFWDSGMSTGEVSPTRGGTLEQQLSPLSDYTDSSSSSGGSPEYQLSLSSPPSHSSTSGYSSSSSPSSSPPTSGGSSRGSSRSPPSAVRAARTPVTASPTLQPTGVKFTLNNNIAAGSNASTVTPQFYIQKKATGNKFTINNGNNINYSNNKGQQITLVSTNQTQSTYPSTITTRVTNSTRITPTIISRNQLSSNNTYNRSINTSTTNNNNIGKPLLSGFKSSPAPSIVTLSGVNKTAGIIKSPSVVNLNRKQTFSNINTTTIPSSATTTTIISSSSNPTTPNDVTTNNNHQQHHPKTFSLVASSDIVVSSASFGSASSSSSPVYKAVTVTSANGRLTGTTGQQFIITPRGTVSGLAAGKFIKSSQNNSIYIPINTKDLDKVRTIKLITKSSSQAVTGSLCTVSKPGTTPTFTTSSAGSTILRASSATNGILVSGRNRTFTTTGLTTSHSGTIRTTTPAGQVSILKNLCLGGKASLTPASGGGYTSLLTIPKEEDYDSDDEGVELPQNGSPLTLTEEEQKLAQKESLKFPSHYPLTKKQERDLKRIRRKIRNKISAQDSRKRKKEYMDKLEERVTVSSRENDRLKIQVASLQETNKKLAEQLKKFQTMMSSQPAPSVASNNNSSSHSNSSSRQHHPSTFLLMMLMSAALFVYPSVVPQVKPGTDLLTAVPHHKMPPAGNSRSLLEAAATKLQVCHDEAHEDELDLEIKPSIAALTDHDYTPPAKRLRYDFGGVTRDGYCMPLLDDTLPPAPPPINKGGPPGGGGDKGGVWRVDEKGGGGDGGGGGGEEDGKVKTFGRTVAKKKSGPDDDPVLQKMEEEVKVEKEIFQHTSKPGNHFSTDALGLAPSLKVDPDLASRFTKEVLESVMSQLSGSGSHNWTLEHNGDAKKNAAVVSAALDSLSQSLVVELAAAAAGRKRLREDIELE